MPTLRTVRYLGLGGSLLLAVTAFQGGARSPFHPAMTPVTIFAGRDGVLTPVCWLLGTGLLIFAWLAGLRLAPTARWAYLTAAMWAVPLLPFLPLGSYDVYSYACQGWQQAAGLDPYSAGVNALGCPWREAVSTTWLDSPAPYGPVFLVLAALAAKLGSTLTGTIALLRLIAVLGVIAIACCLPPLARRCGIPLPRAIWLALACPLIPIHLISGAHNDAVMVALLTTALAVAISKTPATVRTNQPPTAAAAGLEGEQTPVPDPGVASGGVDSAGAGVPGPEAGTSARPLGGWSVGRVLVAGVLIGLAVGVKATAVVVLPFAVLAGVPVGSSWWVQGKALAVMAGGAVAAIAAVSVGSGLGFGWVVNLAGSGASVQWTSPSTAVGMTVDLVASWFGVQSDAVAVSRVIGVLILVAVLAVVFARTRNGLVGAGVALAATVALAPVFHPWYATWPLAVLAATTDRHTKWLAGVCAVAAALCLPDGYNLALAVKSQGALLMTGLLIFLAVRQLRARRPV